MFAAFFANLSQKFRKNFALGDLANKGLPIYPLGALSARPNPKMGAPDPENPLFVGFSALRGGSRPWSRKGPDHGVGVDPETVRDCGHKSLQTSSQATRESAPFWDDRAWPPIGPARLTSSGAASLISEVGERAEYCFESTVSEERTH